MIRMLASLLILATQPAIGFGQVDSVTEVEFGCGGAEVKIEVVRRDAPQRELRVEAVLTATRDGVSTVLRYWGTVDYIGGMCAQDAANRPRIVYKAQCGGSGCDTESNWGIIDPVTLRVLLVPRDGNVDQAQEILGAELPTIDRVISVYRADQQLYPDQQ